MVQDAKIVTLKSGKQLFVDVEGSAELPTLFCEFQQFEA